MHRSIVPDPKQIKGMEHDHSIGLLEKPIGAKRRKYTQFTKIGAVNADAVDDDKAYQLRELYIEPVITNVVNAHGVTFYTNAPLEEVCQTGYLLEITPIDDHEFDRELCHISHFSEICKVCFKDLSDSIDKVSFFNEFGEINVEIKNISTSLRSMNVEVSRAVGVPQQLCVECYNIFTKMTLFYEICRRSKNLLNNISEFATKQLQTVKVEANVDYENLILNTIAIKNEIEDVNRTCDAEIFKEAEPYSANTKSNSQSLGKNRLYVCIRCGYSCRVDSLLWHMDYVRYLDKECPECRICNLKLSNVDELDRYLSSCHNSFSCIKCSKSFSSLSNYDRHQKYHKSYICDFCAQVCHSKIHMRQHLKNHILGLYPCDFCNEWFKSRKDAGIHKKNVHPNDLYKCTQCLKEFKMKDAYRSHLKSHSPNKPHKCSFCEKQFVYKHHLENHVRSHTKVNEFLCNFCGKTFRVQVGLRAHLAIHDPTSYPKIKKKASTRISYCNICSYTTNQNGNMKKHINSLHGKPRNFEFECQICDKQFKLAASLENHLQTHNEVRNFHCNQCKASFRKAYYLRLHINGVHLKLRPNKCNECDAAYLLSNDLKRHKMLKHSAESPFQCCYCQKKFLIPLYLKNHINRVHHPKIGK